MLKKKKKASYSGEHVLARGGGQKEEDRAWCFTVCCTGKQCHHMVQLNFTAMKINKITGKFTLHIIKQSTSSGLNRSLIQRPNFVLSWANISHHPAQAQSSFPTFHVPLTATPNCKWPPSPTLSNKLCDSMLNSTVQPIQHRLIHLHSSIIHFFYIIAECYCPNLHNSH